MVANVEYCREVPAHRFRSVVTLARTVMMERQPGGRNKWEIRTWGWHVCTALSRSVAETGHGRIAGEGGVGV